MTTAIEDACTEIATVLRAVPGLELVPINPPATMNVQQFCVTYPESGKLDVGPIGTRRAFHNIAVDVCRTRMDLATDTLLLKPFIDLVPAALIAEISTGGDQFSGKIITFLSITYAWVSWDYGKVPVYGYHFIMTDVKLMVNS